jgi:cobalt/nickel transport system permease protein
MSHIHALDQYHEEDSPIHRLDARPKLVVTLAFIVAITAIPHGAWPSLLLLLGTISILVILSRVPPLVVLRRSMVALPFALAAVTLVFTIDGTPLGSLKLASWHISITHQGIVAFTSIMIKAWLAVLVATLLTTTTTFPDLLVAMRGLRLPRVIISIISFMYRYIFVIADEALRLQRAREARSADPDGKGGGSIVWKASVLGGMVGSLFLRSYERSERIYAAMVSRGFDGTIRAMRAQELSLTDFMVCLGFITYLLAIVTLSRVPLRM